MTVEAESHDPNANASVAKARGKKPSFTSRLRSSLTRSDSSLSISGVSIINQLKSSFSRRTSDDSTGKDSGGWTTKDNGVICKRIEDDDDDDDNNNNRRRSFHKRRAFSLSYTLDPMECQGAFLEALAVDPGDPETNDTGAIGDSSSNKGDGELK
mmetsp:Transcript_35012/g.73859  ORF Transcript_35012/g.73859 Transcript_35012/m.73859 type:complete len:155 (-) Transcript_35012:277-741(-)